MPTTIQPQGWGVRGASVALSSPDPTGITIPSNGPNLVLVARNTGGVALPVRVAARTCRHGRAIHYLQEAIPNDSARHLIPLGMSRARGRFGTPVQVTFPGGVTGLTVAAALLADHHGVGNDAETPPALGSTPGTVVVTGKDEDQVFTDCDADGMRLANDGYVYPLIQNISAGDRTIYVRGSLPCNFGFFDDEVVVVPANTLHIGKLMPVGRFGRLVSITYPDATGLSIAAVRQEAYAG